MSAVFSRCRRYRYRLARDLGLLGKGAVAFLMLNPSTADETEDDPTIRRCIGFAHAWGYKRLEIVNLFAWRATDPAELKRAADPVGRPKNDRTIIEVAYECDLICAWGVHGKLFGRDAEVLSLLASADLTCLGVTKAGDPKHPLYLRADSARVPF